MASDVEIKIGADIAELRQALADATSATRGFTDQVSESFQGMKGGIGEAFSGVLESVNGLSGGVTGAMNQIRSSFAGAFAIGGLGAAAAGIGAIVDKMASLGEEATHLETAASIIGVTVEQFQALAVASRQVGADQDIAAHGIEHLNQLLAEAREGSSSARGKLLDVGISLEQIRDPGFGAGQMIEALGKALNTSSTSAQTHAALVNLLGPRYAQAAEAIKKLTGELGGFEKASSSVNALTEAQTHALAGLAERWDSWKASVHNAIAGFVADVAAMNQSSLKGLESQRAMFDLIAKQNPGNGQGAWAAQQSAAVQKQIDDIRGVNNAQADAAQEAVSISAGETAAKTALTETEKKVALAAIQDQIAATKNGTTERLAAVKQYYAQLSAFYGSDSDAALAAHRQVIEAARELNEKQAEDTKQAAEKAYRAAQAAERAYVEDVRTGVAQILESSEQYFAALEKQDAETKARAELAKTSALAQIQAQSDVLAAQSKSQHGSALADNSAQQQQLAAQQILIWHTYYDQLRTLAHGSATQIAQIDAAELKTDADIVKAGTALQAKAAADVTKMWDSVAKNFASSMASSFRGVIEGTTSVSKAFQQMGSQIVDKLIEVGLERTVQHLINLAMNKTEQTSDAAVAAAGAAKSAAAIPYVGWILAPLAAAAVYTAATAFSAAQGFDVPSGLNPVTQLHSREMVLPANLADTIRGMSGRGEGAAGGDTHHHWHISSTDPKHFENWSRTAEGKRTVARAVSGASKQNYRPA